MTEDHNSVGEHQTACPKDMTPYEKMKYLIKYDRRIQQEITQGKRIGFYSLRGDLGAGNFSRVKAAVHSLTNEKVAVKILDKRKMDKKTKKLLSHEISSMEKLHHPHIIQLYEVIHSPTKLHLVMEYAAGGELFTKLSTQGKLTEADAKIIFMQVTHAVQHMHRHKVIHRDLKAENVLYFGKRNVKVCDFGFSTASSRYGGTLDTFCGSPPYAAPELFQDSYYCGESVDVWALGVLLYFSVTGTMPFRAETVGKLKKNILAGNFSIPSHISAKCRFLIKSILRTKPLERATLADILDSDWLIRIPLPRAHEFYRLDPSKVRMKEGVRTAEAYALLQLQRLGITRSKLQTFPVHLPAWNTVEYRTDHMTSEQQSVEWGAVIGSYRILLAQTHNRLSSSSNNDENQRLREAMDSSIILRDDVIDDVKDGEHVCAFCLSHSTPSSDPSPLTLGGSGELSSSPLGGNGNKLSPLSHDQSRRPSNNSSLAPPTGAGDNLVITNAQRRRSAQVVTSRVTLSHRQGRSAVKSRFCSIL